MKSFTVRYKGKLTSRSPRGNPNKKKNTEGGKKGEKVASE